MTVKQIQCLLTYLGYSPGTIDGADGRNTQAAIRAFLEAWGQGLGVDQISRAMAQAVFAQYPVGAAEFPG